MTKTINLKLGPHATPADRQRIVETVQRLDRAMDDTCQSCRFYTDETCRKNPPAVVVLGGSIRSAHPPVSPGDWCGGFERRERGK